MEEVWKNVDNYENYQVSNLGRVKRITGNKERILKNYLNTKGYAYVVFFKNNKRKNIYIHRLVAQAFIPNSDNLPIINHKDENKTNNHVENLEWCSYKYNTNYGSCIEKITRKQNKKVYQYTLNGEFIREWKSAKDAEKQFGRSHHIGEVCHGKRKTAYGYKWRYEKILGV